MSTSELKQLIIEDLSLIEDVSFLRAIKQLLASKASESIYELNEVQEERIVSGRKQLKDGLTFSHQDIQNDIDQWINEK